ncbi:hypothetical protein [Mesoflavibacter zeaxanthinifaciens]|uniref:hypothetical protein n=1 Tax=Mesoflavibacter zeaxanthinifaciens TaxID=393060 RepID=UPI003A8F4402
MIESIKYATIANIYVKDLIFYNKDKITALIEFCNHNGISHLPDIDRKSIYKLENDTFQKVPLTQNLICHPMDRLFDEKTINKFEQGDHDEVMFVIEDNLIKGVVHIVDYNDDFLNIEFYKASYKLERMLREYLLACGENNDSIINWMKEKAVKSAFWENRYAQCMPTDEEKRSQLIKKRKDLKEFQTFYLNDLLFFAASKGLVSKNFKKNIEAVKQVRNWVAHSKDLAYRSGDIDKPLYRIKELKSFVANANQFFECYEELEFKSLNKQFVGLGF